MRNILVLISFIFSWYSNAQKYPFYQNYDFETTTDNRAPHDEDLMYYYTKYLLVAEYAYDENEQAFYKYQTEHYKVKLNKDAGIEEFNKIYLSLEDVVAVEFVMVNIFKPDGTKKQVEVNQELFYSEDEKESYAYFSIGGLEINDELEIGYILKKEPLFNGDQFYFQGEVPIYNFDFKLIAPSDTYFRFLAHNRLPEPVLIDTILQRHQYDIHLDEISAFKTEYFSEYNNAVMKLDVAIDHITGYNWEPYTAFNSYRDYVKEMYYTTPKNSDLKALDKLNEQIGVYQTQNKEEQVRKIENYMKNKFLIGYGAPNMTIKEMIKANRADGVGAIQLYLLLMKSAGIQYQIGFTTDRYDTRFPTAFESEYFLQNYFIFLPEINKYLAPLDYESRLGYPNYSWIPNNGIYFKDVNYISYKVDTLPALASTENRDSTIITIQPNKDLTTARILIERHSKGYKSGVHQVFYHLYSTQKKKEVHEEFLNIFKDNSTVKVTAVENTMAEDAYVRPFIIKGEITVPYSPILEKANDKTILKLGNIFGTYINPKELTKKQSDFVFAYAFKRDIVVKVEFPTAVKIANTESIPEFDKLTELESTHISSSLSVTDLSLTYHQTDHYKNYRYPLSQKEQLIKIFQFHSDLSKINLIVE